jgi:N-sulfoglucosamine sulfohydrolase
MGRTAVTPTVRATVVVVLGLLAAPAAAAPPHVVIYLADDHGQEFAGCYGNPTIRTPHLDALARQGARFTHAFAASPTCAPSRAALFTGLYPARNGLMGNHTASRAGVQSLPAYLRPLGYRVVLANKTHVRPAAVYDFEPLPATLPPDPARDRRYRAEGLDTRAVERFLADHARDRPGQPLCLVLADDGPHVVWEKNRTYDPAALPLSPLLIDTPKTRAALANYYQDVTSTDRRLGEVLAALARHGFADDALVVYASDQGSEWPRCKWTLYDSGLRVPFVARWPGRVAPGSVCDALVSLVDVTPTLVELAGGPAPAGLDGRSFRDVLLGRAAAFRDEVYATHTGDGTMNRFPQRGVRDGRHKYILNLHPERAWSSHFTRVPGIPDSHKEVWDSWLERAKADPAAARLVAAVERHPAEELYDVTADPYELTNLAGWAELRPVLERMRDRLRRWREAQGDAGATE